MRVIQSERDTWAAFQRWGCDWGVMVSMVPFARARSKELICIRHRLQPCQQSNVLHERKVDAKARAAQQNCKILQAADSSGMKADVPL